MVKISSQILIIVSLFILSSCQKDDTSIAFTKKLTIGFTSWPYGPNLEDVDNTYSFVEENGTIYAEHIDNNIPWDSWINDKTLPTEFINDIDGRVSRKIPNKEFLLSVSILNPTREELANGFDGIPPPYTQVDDRQIKEAYFKHVDYLVNRLQPDFLVIAIEVNELRLRSPEKWVPYKNLINEVKAKIKEGYPELKVSESISLHSLYEPEFSDPQAYIDDIMEHMNKNDFIAISFYPFLKGMSSKEDFQKAFDFLHAEAQKPIAFVETAHIAENLIIPNLNVSISGNENEQKVYLETLIENGQNENYEFIIWWAHRDFDALWETFPSELKDLGKIWRDTGLLDENGSERPAFSVWSDQLELK